MIWHPAAVVEGVAVAGWHEVRIEGRQKPMDDSYSLVDAGFYRWSTCEEIRELFDMATGAISKRQLMLIRASCCSLFLSYCDHSSCETLVRTIEGFSEGVISISDQRDIVNRSIAEYSEYIRSSIHDEMERLDVETIERMHRLPVARTTSKQRRNEPIWEPDIRSVSVRRNILWYKLQWEFMKPLLQMSQCFDYWSVDDELQSTILTLAQCDDYKCAIDNRIEEWNYIQSKDLGWYLRNIENAEPLPDSPNDDNAWGYRNNIIVSHLDDYQFQRSFSRSLCDIIRHIVPNPYDDDSRFDTFRQPGVLAIAEEIDRSRVFTTMSRLSEAIEIAGCQEWDVFSHCLRTDPTIRGSWLVDQLLKKSDLAPP